MPCSTATPGCRRLRSAWSTRTPMLERSDRCWTSSTPRPPAPTCTLQPPSCCWRRDCCTWRACTWPRPAAAGKTPRRPRSGCTAASACCAGPAGRRAWPWPPAFNSTASARPFSPGPAGWGEKPVRRPAGPRQGALGAPGAGRRVHLPRTEAALATAHLAQVMSRSGKERRLRPHVSSRTPFRRSRRPSGR